MVAGPWHRCIAASAARPSLAIALLLLSAATPLAAQDSDPASYAGWSIGGSLGMLGYGRQTLPLDLTTVGVHLTQVRPGRIGADLSFGTIPRILAEGVVVVGARVGATLPIAVAPGVLFLPSAGVTTVVVAGGGDGGALGYNLGGAAMLGTGPVAFRTGVTWHRLLDSTGGFWLLEVGIASVPRPPSR